MKAEDISLISAELRRKGECNCYSCLIIELNRQEKEVAERKEILVGSQKELTTGVDEES